MSFKKALFAVPLLAAMVAINTLPAMAWPSLSSDFIPTTSHASLSSIQSPCISVQPTCQQVLTQSMVVPVDICNTGCGNNIGNLNGLGNLRGRFGRDLYDDRGFFERMFD